MTRDLDRVVFGAAVGVAFFIAWLDAMLMSVATFYGWTP